MGTTPVYGWPYPDPSDLVRDAPTAFENLADAIEATLGTELKILQVAQTVKTDTFTTTSTSYTDITGLTVSMTAASTANKVLLVAQVNVSPPDASSPGVHLRFNGGNSDLFVGDAANSRTRSAATISRVGGGVWASDNMLWTVGLTYLASPASTAATTYAVQILTSTGGACYVNRSTSVDADATATGRTASSILALEVKG